MTTLLDLVTNPECHGDVDTLVVDWLGHNGVINDGWTFRHLIGLAKLLNKHRVKKLIFAINLKPASKYHLDLLAGDNPENGKFVPIHYLRSVEIDTRHFSSFMTSFVEWSRASSVTYRIDDTSLECQNQAAWLCGNYSALLRSNFSLRKMTFIQDISPNPQIVEPSKQCYKRDVTAVQSALQRNLIAFEKCQKAIITLLSLRRKKLLNLHRDTFSMVIDMVWSTKGRRVWTEGEQCEEFE